MAAPGDAKAEEPLEDSSSAMASGPDVIPPGRCQFSLSAPRHFLYPALLLLLAEQPRHGYRLVDGFNRLGVGTVDRPSVYRALADLEGDGLVRTWDEAPAAGSTRHVYAVTSQGERALEAWMSIVAKERDSLEVVLERYWYCNAKRLAQPAEAWGPVAGVPTREAERRARFEVQPDRSSVLVEARSNVGPIAFAATSLTGGIDVELHDGLVTKDTLPSAHLDVEVTNLSSGNALYDRELMRRLDARRFPWVTVELRALRHVGDGNCYQVEGDVTLHGSTQTVDGMVTATIQERPQRDLDGRWQTRRSMMIAGEQVLDIRRFGMDVPSMPLFKIYPDVRLRLHLDAEEMTPGSEVPHEPARSA
ncbi:MAG: helix-turn-helix transcriptional regulator [Acidimicrobiales bacterium]